MFIAHRSIKDTFLLELKIGKANQHLALLQLQVQLREIQ